MPNDYQKQTARMRTESLRKLERELPQCCLDYFIAIESQTGTLTRLAYAYDLRIFFQYLSAEVRKFGGKDVLSFDDEDLRKITKADIERYGQYLTLYYKNDIDEDGNVSSRELENAECGKMRKLS